MYGTICCEALLHRVQHVFAIMKYMNIDSDAWPCADKIIFETKKDAQTAATVALHRYGGVVKPYRCKYCDLWHLASNY